MVQIKQMNMSVGCFFFANENSTLLIKATETSYDLH